MPAIIFVRIDQPTQALNDEIKEIIIDDATQQTAGAMSAADKKKLDNINSNNSSAYEIQLSSVNPTAVFAPKPTIEGLYKLSLYLRIAVAATFVTITVTYTDRGGAQTYSAQVRAQFDVGSYSLPVVPLASLAGFPVTVTVTAETANQVFVSCSLDS